MPAGDVRRSYMRLTRTNGMSVWLEASEVSSFQENMDEKKRPQLTVFMRANVAYHFRLTPTKFIEILEATSGVRLFIHDESRFGVDAVAAEAALVEAAD